MRLAPRSIAPLIVVLALLPAVAHAECRASPSGAHSYDLRVSPRAGVLCLMIADVHAGASCEGEPDWSVDLSCGQVRRMAIGDRGQLISILAPRASHREWPIVMVTARDRPPVRLRLADLPGIDALPGAIAFDFEGAALRLRGRRDEVARVTFDAIDALVEARRRTSP